MNHFKIILMAFIPVFFILSTVGLIINSLIKANAKLFQVIYSMYHE